MFDALVIIGMGLFAVSGLVILVVMNGFAESEDLR